MLEHNDLKGADLPPKTLCLTYDDGPGPETVDLAHFLFEEEIRATFFVIGRHAEHHEDVLAELRRCGHLLGNHTYSHPGLVSMTEAGGDVASELARTDAIL